MVPVLKIQDMFQLKREHFRISTHSKSCYVLSCRLEGESTFFYDGQTSTVKRGDILYIPMGACYTQQTEHERVVVFHLEAYTPMPRQLRIISTNQPDQICALFQSALQNWEQRQEAGMCMAYSLLYRILAQLPVRSESLQPKTVMDQARDYLNAHLFDPEFTVETLCAQVYVSRTYFNRMFRRLHGITPVEYINRQRVEKAKQILKSGNYTNEETASLCGFRDVKYFYAVFRKYTGMTTTQWKNAP